MKKTFFATTAGILAGAALFVCAAPAMAHDHIDFSLSLGVPLAYVAPAPVYVPAPYYPPAPVVYGGYGPVVTVGAPYYYGGWRYRHGWRDHDGWRDRDGWHRHGDRGEHRGWRH